VSAHALDNPIWNALTSVHARFAEEAGFVEESGLARRYPPKVSPLAALYEPSAMAFEAMARILGSGGMAGFFTTDLWDLPDGWTSVYTGLISQMICEKLLDAPDIPARVLETSDAGAMLELAQLTKPGPFEERTVELGTYLGIHDAGRLVAMAGERFRLKGFTEISAVCTHPEYRARGYARALVHRLASSIIVRGEIPFLHVMTDNANAIRAYESLGFHERRQIRVLVLKAPA
jgi:ribosomal protein S18 acetylase RimI-like enzyme